MQPTVVRDSRNNKIYINPRYNVFVIDDGNVIYNKGFHKPTITRRGDKIKIKREFGTARKYNIGTTVVFYDTNRVIKCSGSNNTIILGTL